MEYWNAIFWVAYVKLVNGDMSTVQKQSHSDVYENVLYKSACIRRSTPVERCYVKAETRRMTADSIMVSGVSMQAEIQKFF